MQLDLRPLKGTREHQHHVFIPNGTNWTQQDSNHGLLASDATAVTLYYVITFLTPEYSGTVYVLYTLQ